jgi:aspartate carbamoyltransferase regulatory subunit
VAESGLLVRRIREGTVIDHIPAGRALTVLRILGITGSEGLRVAVVMNVESRKLGRKDIVKIEGRHLSQEELNKIALVAPTATINRIRGGRVVEKTKVRLPELLHDILRCPNPTCITRKPREPVAPRFRLVSRSPILYRCVYCGTILDEADIVEQLGTGRRGEH